MLGQLTVLLMLTMMCGCATAPETKAPQPQATSVNELVRQADAAFTAKQYEDAARLYEECVKKYPRGSARFAFTQRFGDSYVFLGKLDRARKAYSFGIEVYGFPKFDIEKRIEQLKRLGDRPALQ